MNCVIRFAFAAVLALWTVTVVAGSATETPTTEVVASGVGIDADKALRNALVNAVQQSVGLVVDAETLVKNEDIIKDQILTYSDGYVEHFDKIKEGKRDDGLYEIKIKAIVKRRQLVEKLREAKVISTKVDGESLFGEVVTHLEAEKDAAKLLEKALEGLPSAFLTAQVVDKKPEILSKDENGIRAVWTIVISFNYEDYLKKVLPSLQKTLDAIAVRKLNSAVPATAKVKLRLPLAKLDFIGPNYHLDANEKTGANQPSLEFWATDLDGYCRSFPVECERSCKEFCQAASGQYHVILNIGRNEAGDNLRYALYALDRTSCEPIFSRLAQRQLTLRVALMDNDQKVIREENVETELIRGYGGTSFDSLCSIEFKQFPWCAVASPKGVLLQPFFYGRTGFNGLSPMYGDKLVVKWLANLSLDEVKRTAEIRCSMLDEKARGQ